MADSSLPPARLDTILPLELFSPKHHPRVIAQALTQERVDALVRRVIEATGNPEAGRQMFAMAQQIVQLVDKLERSELEEHRLTRRAEALGLLPPGSASAQQRRWR